MHRLAELLLDDRHQIVAREGAEAVLLRIGPGHDDGEQFGLLVECQHRRTAAVPVVAEPGDTVRVVADDPVPERLAVHAGALRRLSTAHALERIGDPQQASGDAGVRLGLGELAQHRRCAVLADLQLRHRSSPRSNRSDHGVRIEGRWESLDGNTSRTLRAPVLDKDWDCPVPRAPRTSYYLTISLG